MPDPNLLRWREVHFLPDSDHAEFAWRGLRRYTNVSLTKEKLIQRHEIPKKQHANALKQSEQIRSCLVQASEYARAATSVDFATKPLHLYYSIMSLALAEILLKGTGDCSLDKLRSNNRAHGLLFPPPTASRDLSNNAIGALIATPDMRVGRAYGTFAVWREYARHTSIVGATTVHLREGLTEVGPRTLLHPADEALPNLPMAGLSLRDCLCNLPLLHTECARSGLRPMTARATIEQETYQDEGGGERSVARISLHPTRRDLTDRIAEGIQLNANLAETVQMQEAARGFTVRFTYGSNWWGSGVSVPEAASISPYDIYFFATLDPLNEFGYYYVALYIAGMYARYYPDLWSRHIDHNTDLFFLVDALCETALRRVPILMLQQFDSCVYLVQRGKRN